MLPLEPHLIFKVFFLKLPKFLSYLTCRNFKIWFFEILKDIEVKVTPESILFPIFSHGDK